MQASRTPTKKASSRGEANVGISRRGGPGAAGALETTPARENVKLKNKNKLVQSRQEPTLGKTAGMGLRIGRLRERIPHNGGQRGRNK